MTQENQNSEVHLAAVKALYNALDFIQANFEDEMERSFIMKIICETAMPNELEIKKASLECLVSISSMYYEIL